MSLSFTLGEVVQDDGTCPFSFEASDGSFAPRASGAVFIDLASGHLSVEGFGGSVSPVVAETQDGRVSKAVFTGQALAGMNWHCAEAQELYTLVYEFTFCRDAGCPTKSVTIDDIGQAAPLSEGGAPPPVIEQPEEAADEAEPKTGEQFHGSARKLLPNARNAKYDRRTRLKRAPRPARIQRAGFENGWQANYRDRGRPFARAEIVAYVYETARAARTAYRNTCSGCRAWKAGRAFGITTKGLLKTQGRNSNRRNRCATMLSVKKNVYVKLFTCGRVSNGAAATYTKKAARFDAKFLTGFVHGRAIGLAR